MTEASLPEPDSQSPGQTAAWTPVRHESVGQLRLRLFLRHRLAVTGLAVVVLLVLGAVLAPLYRFDPEDIDLRARLEPPTLTHLMGTDDLGRDVFARVLHGGRISLAVGGLATSLSLLVGALVGSLAGYYGGWLDNLLMRLTDIFLSFPSLFVLILVSAIIRDTPLSAIRGGLFTIVVVIALLSWMVTARLVRASFIALREREFVLAARAIGAPSRRLILVHYLPNSLGPIIVQGALQTAYSILTESGLSYLGFGIQPPTPTWGNMLNDAQTYMTRNPWLAVFPGLMIFITVLCVNFIGDGLRDAFDPRMVQSKK